MNGSGHDLEDFKMSKRWGEPVEEDEWDCPLWLRIAWGVAGLAALIYGVTR